MTDTPTLPPSLSNQAWQASELPAEALERLASVARQAAEAGA